LIDIKAATPLCANSWNMPGRRADMKTIIVQIEGDDGQDARLQAAFDLVRAFEGNLVCLQVTPYAAYAMGDPATGGFAIASLMEAIDKQRSTERAAVEARVKPEGISWSWVSLDGDFVERLSETSRLADAVVMNSGPFAQAAGMRLSRTGDAAMHTRVPVIAVPPASRGLAVTGSALVAWDGSQESAVALRAALPMLRLADSVDVLTVEEKAHGYRARDAAVFLSRHGIEAEVIERKSEGQSVEAVIRNVLTERRSAWLVQGAYGHSRLRQTLFGGVTRGLLADAPVPLVLAH
jgi:nucleotide-binding universal stress UspA family protein